MLTDTRIRVLTVLSASAVAIATVAGPARPVASGPDDQPQRTPVAAALNGVLFEEHVRSTMDGIVKGYAFAVADRDGKIQAKAAGGWAQDPSDGNVRMTTTTATAIGSVTKVLSGAALLHLFERHMLANTSVEAQLDTSMLSKLPEKWRFQWRGRNLERITYRHLLQHKSGFRDASCNGKTLSPLDQLAAGVKIEDVGKLRCYNNFNYYLMRYLIASIAYPGEMAAIHKKYEDLSLEDYTEKVNIEFSQQYERFMRDEFLPRSLDKLLTTCRPQKDLPARAAAKGYTSKDDREGAFLQTLDWEKSAESYCPSQGSWYLSAESLALFGRNLLYTDRWVSAATRKEMFDPAKSDDEFPWAGTVRNDDFGQEMGQSLWPSHGGSQDGYKAALVQLPYGYVGAALINSADRESSQIAKTLMDAFYAGTRGKPISRTKHGMTPAAYQAYVSELDEGAHTIDWIDFYDVGRQVFVNVIVRPAGTRGKNYVRHGLTGTQYQQEYDRHVTNGRRRLLLIDSYLDDGQVRYAFIMGSGESSAPAYHGADAAEHKKLFDTYTSRGFVPTSVSVVSVNGERRFSTSWEAGRPGGLMVRSTLDGREYQELANDMAARKMALTYLNTYVHQGEVQYSAIFVGGAGRSQEWRHGLTSRQYQDTFDTLIGKGLGLRLVTGAGAGSGQIFAAVWER